MLSFTGVGRHFTDRKGMFLVPYFPFNNKARKTANEQIFKYQIFLTLLAHER